MELLLLQCPPFGPDVGVQATGHCPQLTAYQWKTGRQMLVVYMYYEWNLGELG